MKNLREEIRNILISCREGKLDEAVQLIMLEMKSYADGKVKESQEHKELIKLIESATSVARKEGFAEAIEQAAKVAEYHSGPSVQCAEKIRDLIEKKAGG